MADLRWWNEVVPGNVGRQKVMLQDQIQSMDAIEES